MPEGPWWSLGDCRHWLQPTGVHCSAEVPPSFSPSPVHENTGAVCLPNFSWLSKCYISGLQDWGCICSDCWVGCLYAHPCFRQGAPQKKDRHLRRDKNHLLHRFPPLGHPQHLVEFRTGLQSRPPLACGQDLLPLAPQGLARGVSILREVSSELATHQDPRGFISLFYRCCL